MRQAIESVIEGKRNSVDLALVVLLAEGHLLIEDVPGVGKTMLAKALGRSIACSVRRIQFTPDLLPSDITGVSVFNAETRDFEFKPGRHLRQHRGRRRDQPRLAEDAVRAAGVDGGTPGQRRRHDVPARVAVHGGGHPEPDRDGGHLSVARGSAGPVHGPDPDGLPDADVGAGHAGVARLLRSARRPAAGHGRRDDPRPDRGRQDGLRQPGGQALPGPGGQHHAQLPRSAARRLPAGHPATAPRQPGLRGPVGPRLRQPR